MGQILAVYEALASKDKINTFFEKNESKNIVNYYRKHINKLHYRTRLKQFDPQRSLKRKKFNVNIKHVMRTVLNLPTDAAILEKDSFFYFSLKNRLAKEVFIFFKRKQKKNLFKYLLKRLYIKKETPKVVVPPKVAYSLQYYIYKKKIRRLFNVLSELNHFQHVLLKSQQDLELFHPHFQVIAETYEDMMKKASIKSLPVSPPVVKLPSLPATKFLEEKNLSKNKIQEYLNVKNALARLWDKKVSLVNLKKKPKFNYLSKKKLWNI